MGPPLWTSLKKQISLIDRNRTSHTVVLGDFNLDAVMQFRLDYPHKLIFNCLNDFQSKFNFQQFVDFPTWSRTIKNVKKESTLDHVYCNDFSLIGKCYFLTPCFGDHVPVVIECIGDTKEPVCFTRRDWRTYNPESLRTLLSNNNLVFDSSSVQQYWNCLENVLINVTDFVAPLITVKSTSSPSRKAPSTISNLNNKRDRL
jgi:hypothetical protein